MKKNRQQIQNHEWKGADKKTMLFNLNIYLKKANGLVVSACADQPGVFLQVTGQATKVIQFWPQTSQRALRTGSKSISCKNDSNNNFETILLRRKNFIQRINLEVDGRVFFMGQLISNQFSSQSLSCKKSHEEWRILCLFICRSRKLEEDHYICITNLKKTSNCSLSQNVY